MDRYIVITIDVEPDCTPSWRYSSPLRFDGVSEGIGRRLQPLFNRFDIAPTYLINNVVLEDPGACRLFKNLEGRFELGTHLHPEFIEPHKTEHLYQGKKGESNCCFYPPDIEFEKIKSITKLFERQFEQLPASFRAGRFSAGPNTIASLAKLHYKVDTSVTPHVCWNDKTREKAVNFSEAPKQPYFVKKQSILDSDGHGEILEVPITIGTRKTNIFRELKRTYFGIRHKIQRRQPVWLRPVFSGLKDFISLTEKYESDYSQNKIIVYNMMFHNVEVMPGLSPYTQTDSECSAYLRQLEQYFTYCTQKGFIGITLQDVYNLYK